MRPPRSPPVPCQTPDLSSYCLSPGPLNRVTAQRRPPTHTRRTRHESLAIRDVSLATDNGRHPPCPQAQAAIYLGQSLAGDFNGPVVERVYPVFFRWQPQARKLSAD